MYRQLMGIRPLFRVFIDYLKNNKTFGGLLYLIRCLNSSTTFTPNGVRVSVFGRRDRNDLWSQPRAQNLRIG